MAFIPRLLLVAATISAGAAVATTACAQEGLQPGPAGSATPSAAPSTPVPQAQVWPLEPRTLTAASPAQPAVLKAIRTERKPTYDRVVFEFGSKPGTVRLSYVAAVHADPSDHTVSLMGNAFLGLTVHDAYARWLGQLPAYGGPDIVTPDYSTLKQITVSGDYEAVLSFGIGVDRVAGFQTAWQSNPDRLVVDFAHRPQWQMWPDDSLVEASTVQISFDAGRVQWRASVVAHFAKEVYGWDEAQITRIPGTDDQYWVSAKDSTERIHVREVFPFARTHANSIAEIAGVR